MDDGFLTKLRRATLQDLDASGSQHLARVTGLKGEELAQVPRLKDFGFSSFPPVGSNALLLALGGRSDRVMILGIDHKDHGPRDLASGHTAIYDGNGNIVSLVGTKVRIVSGSRVEIVAPVIVLNGDVHLGGEGGVPASKQGTIDSGGNVDVAYLATKVFVT